MATVRVRVGSYIHGAGGVTEDMRQFVAFEAEELGSYTASHPSGMTQILYQIPDGSYVVWEEELGRCDGDYTCLIKVEQGDFEPRGYFSRLAQQCGLTRPLTLEEALEL